MICPDCHGTGVGGFGRLAQPVRGTRLVRLPCVTCGGSGVAYCCDHAGSAGNEPAPTAARPQPYVGANGGNGCKPR